MDMETVNLTQLDQNDLNPTAGFALRVVSGKCQEKSSAAIVPIWENFGSNFERTKKALK